jgi:hypothetical protein
MWKKTDALDSYPGPAVPEGMHRREFLLLSVTGLVGLASASLSAQIAGPASSPKRTPLAVGYFGDPREGSSQARNAIVAADSLPAGDPRFAGAALVKFIGFWRPKTSRLTPLSATLLTYYPATADHDKLPFVTWVYRSDTGGILATPHAVAQVPIDSDGLTLALLTGTPAPIVPKEFQPALRRVVSGKVSEVLPSRTDLTVSGEVFTLGTTGSVGPKLRAGTYFIALTQRADGRIDWSSVRVADLRLPASLDPQGDGPLSLASRSGSIPVAFAYLALSIGPGPPPRPRAGRKP